MLEARTIRRRPRPRPGWVRLCFLLLGCPLALAAEPSTADESPRAGGGLIWDLADELDLLGDLWVDLPFSVGRRPGFFFSLDTRTSIEKTTSELTFVVRDLDYALDLGWRRRRGSHSYRVFAGQTGKERVDADGQPYVRYVAFGLEGRRGEWLDWRLAAGPVLEQCEVDADAVLRAAARYRLWGGARGLATGLGLDVELDGLADAGRLRADVRAGPSLTLELAGGHQAGFFVHYQRSRNPLGIGHSALLGGFEYRDGPAAGRGGPGAPAVDGLLAAGGGDDGRLAGEFQLRVLSPPLARSLWAVFLVDANVLTARDTGELYYLLHVGLERALHRSIAGVYFYHRSNHQLAEPNDRITSINVLELGLETAGWQRPGRRRPVRPWGDLGARARVGYLIDSDFGEDRRWHLRGGLRWSVPLRLGPATPYLFIEGERGDVERETYAVGFSLSEAVDLQLEHRSDEQYYGSDRSALLLTSRVAF